MIEQSPIFLPIYSFVTGVIFVITGLFLESVSKNDILNGCVIGLVTGTLLHYPVFVANYPHFCSMFALGCAATLLLLAKLQSHTQK